MPPGIVHYSGAPIPHVAAQSKHHLDAMGSLTPTKSQQNHTSGISFFETDHQLFRVTNIENNQQGASKQLFSWNASENNPKNQQGSKMSITSTSSFDAFFPASSSSINAIGKNNNYYNDINNSKTLETNNYQQQQQQPSTTSSFGIGVTKDMIDQIKSTRAQLNLLAQQPQYQHPLQNDDGSTFQHLNKGKISSSWDIHPQQQQQDATSPDFHQQMNISALSPSPAPANRSSTQSSSRNRVITNRTNGFSVSPLPTHDDAQEGQDESSVSTSRRPPWNYRAGKAALAKDADPAAALGENEETTAPASSTASNIVAKKMNVSTLKNKINTNAKSSSPSSLNSSLSKIDNQEKIVDKKKIGASSSSVRSTSASRPKAGTHRTPSPTIAGVIVAKKNSALPQQKPQQQVEKPSAITSRTFFPSPLRRTENGDEQHQQQVNTARRSSLVAETNNKPSNSPPLAPQTATTTTTVAKKTIKPSSTPVSNNRTSSSKNNQQQQQPQQIFMTQEQVTAMIGQAVHALEERINRQDAEMRTLRHEHSALQIAHNALREQHSDLVDFVGLQLNELRGLNDGTSSEGTQRALAMIDAEVEGSTPPTMMAMNALLSLKKNQQPFSSAASSSVGVVSPSPIRKPQQQQQQNYQHRTPTRIVTGSGLPPSPPIVLK